MRIISLLTMIGICLAATAIAQEKLPPPKGKALAEAILEELRLLEAATDQHAIEFNLVEGTVVHPAAIREYLSLKGRLYLIYTDAAGFIDLLGHPYGTCVVGQAPHVPRATFEALKSFVPEDFWKPYSPE